MPLATMKDLLVSHLNELHANERHLAELLPALARAASSQELADKLRSHASEAKEHGSRLASVFRELGTRPHSSNSETRGMKGLAQDCLHLARSHGAEPHVRDAAIIGAVQHLKHDEIAGYGCARTWARLLGHPSVSRTLQDILDEERDFDGELTRLAESVNERALQI